MLDKFKKAAGAIKNAASKGISNAADQISGIADLNSDGKIDSEDLRLAKEKAKDGGKYLADKTEPIRDAVGKNDLAKDAATGAAIGAVVAAPLPVVGSITGAAIGAGLGVYKNLTTKKSTVQSLPPPEKEVDLHAELIKLEDLRTRGLLSDAEFSKLKSALIKRTQA